MLRRYASAPLVVLALLTMTTACVPNANSGDTNGSVTVDSTADSCTLSASTAPSGSLVFRMTNSGDSVTEFYLLGADKLRIVGEVENIGPGITRDLVVQAAPGEYYSTCKPGAGEKVGTAKFTVTDSGADIRPTGDAAARIADANAAYAAYVRSQVDDLLTGTIEFAEAYRTGRDDTARSLYAPTRAHWERIETVAESFGDLDPRMDLREADLAPGQEWTGWHAIEKDLWPEDAEPGFTAYPTERRIALATQLVDDTRTLESKVAGLEFTLAQQANGAIGLLDEVATGKVTGEEEKWSHTDLWDFQANVDGARVLYEGLRELLRESDPALVGTLDTRFATLQAELDRHRVGDGFVLYTTLAAGDIRALSDDVNALAEPLSRLASALVL